MCIIAYLLRKQQVAKLRSLNKYIYLLTKKNAFREMSNDLSYVKFSKENIGPRRALSQKVEHTKTFKIS